LRSRKTDITLAEILMPEVKGGTFGCIA
jgi:hypothetical protein